MQIAVGDVVLAAARSLRARECDARIGEPKRIAGEIEDAGESAHIGHRRTERRGYHPHRRDVDLAVLVRRILETNQRENSVDLVERELFLVPALHREDLESLLR